MSQGNTNEQGNGARSNFSWQHSMLKLLTGASSAGLMTNATGLQILNAVQNEKDFGIQLVRDTGNADQIVMLLTIRNEDTGAITQTYLDAAGAVYVPVGPLEFVSSENLTPAKDGVLVYGSDDGGTTNRIIHTDSAGDMQVDLASAIPTGENHIGSVGGNTVLSTSTITFSVGGAGATGDYMGTSATPQSFANVVRLVNGTGVIKSLTIVDKLTTAAVDLELWLYSATFTAPTDNAAWTISDTDALLFLGVIKITGSDWVASAANKSYTNYNISLPIKPAATSLFYALVARGTTPAWATGDIQMTLGILQD